MKAQFFIIFSILVSVSADTDNMGDISKMDGNVKHATTEDTANFIFSVLKKSMEISCDAYATFFKGNFLKK